MSKYTIGIMSETWDVEAPSVDIAVMALRIWGCYPTIPIVNYSGDEQSKFMNLLGATDETVKIVDEFVDKNKDVIRKAIHDIRAAKPKTKDKER
jgi:hypothetical protein